MAEDELKDSILLVLTNKQDLPNAMSVQEITEKLGLNNLKDRLWRKCLRISRGTIDAWSTVLFRQFHQQQTFKAHVPQMEMVCMKDLSGCRTHYQRER